jgi:septum formation protein
MVLERTEMSNWNLILASTSRHRRALLHQAGLGHLTCVAPRCDENVDGLEISPSEQVALLARRKAESVGVAYPGALIIGSDQVVELDGEVLGKPGSAERAVEQLARLSGRSHRLLTGLCVHEPSTGRSEVAVSEHVMSMWPFTREQLRRYVELDQPLDCAGSYRVESAGVTLFESMRGEDYTAIVGLPMCLLARLLTLFGVTLLDITRER